MQQLELLLCDPASGLAPNPFPRQHPTREQFEDAIGTPEQRIEFAVAHGYEVDAVLAASNEFRRLVPGAGAFRWMTRGEAIHIARALGAVRA